METVRQPLEIPPSADSPQITASRKIEAHILGMLIRRPDLLYRLDRALQESSLARMSSDDFGHTDHQILFRLVRQSLEQDSTEPDRFLIDNLLESLAPMVENLLAGTESLTPWKTAFLKIFSEA